jgi:hypothetical protein
MDEVMVLRRLSEVGMSAEGSDWAQVPGRRKSAPAQRDRQQWSEARCLAVAREAHPLVWERIL